MSSYVSLNTSNFTGGQIGVNNQTNEIKNNNFIGKSISTGLWGVNTAIGGVSTYMVETAPAPARILSCGIMEMNRSLKCVSA